VGPSNSSYFVFNEATVVKWSQPLTKFHVIIGLDFRLAFLRVYIYIYIYIYLLQSRPTDWYSAKSLDLLFGFKLDWITCCPGGGFLFFLRLAMRMAEYYLEIGHNRPITNA
jgi:hypothetical protein